MQKVSQRPETIAAIATPHGQGGIGVVRLSGSDLASVAALLLGKVPEPRRATYASFLDSHGQAMDQGIALFFPAPHSYTGEDVLELQGHGGTAILQMVLQRCLELGARLAQPGEFTQRAFLNNKLDLAQAESVADLIAATTSQAARSAMRSLQGDFSRAVHRLVDELILLRMLVEAMLDFPEEEIDVPDTMQRDTRLSALLTELEKILSLAKQGSLLREGAHIVLVGQPNVGKSSLLNRLSGGDVALVSEFPGTTRDLISQSIQISGVPLHIIDTAGLREAEDTVERMGIARTYGAVNKADAILVLMDASRGKTDPDQKILDELPLEIPRLYIFNKIDLLARPGSMEEHCGECHIYLSAKTGEGIDYLHQKLLSLLGWHQESGIYMARERHVQALMSAKNHLQRAAGEIVRPELCAEELRLAQESLNSITGEFSADDLLGEIFGRFCIGK